MQAMNAFLILQISWDILNTVQVQCFTFKSFQENKAAFHREKGRPSYFLDIKAHYFYPVKLILSCVLVNNTKLHTMLYVRGTSGVTTVLPLS